MLVVTGRPESMDEIERLSLEHVARSREEPGCVSHGVNRDLEQPLRLVFLEEWADRAALAAHFAVPASQEFSKALARLAAGSTTLRIYEGEPTRV